MSKKLTLLQEAFLEAEELKKTAIKDAETAIRESLAPKLTSILARQLAEDLDEEMADDEEEKLDETSHDSEEDDSEDEETVKEEVGLSAAEIVKPTGMDKKAFKQQDFKSGMTVAPRMSYKDEKELLAKSGKVTKVENDKITFKVGNQEQSMPPEDLFIVAGSVSENTKEEDVEDTDESFDIDALLAEMEAEDSDEEKLDETKDEEESEEESEEEKKEDEEEMDEEFDLNAILETEDEESEEEKMDEAKGEGILMSVLAPVLKKFGVSDDVIKKMTDKGREISTALQNQGVSLSEKKEEKEEDVEEKSKEVDELKETLKEVNLMNIKLLYPTKIAFNYDLSKKQKKTVLEAFDGVKSKKEAELVFETLSNILKDSKTKSQNKQTLKENLGFSSSSKGSSTKQMITEADEFKLKMQKRAGIIK